MNNPFAVAKKYLSDDGQEKWDGSATAEAELAETGTVVNGKIIAVLIDSAVLEARLWLAFEKTFLPDDNIPVFYQDELDFLKNKNRETLRKIYEAKGTFGVRTRVRQ